jgi:hypothetical protein
MSWLIGQGLCTPLWQEGKRGSFRDQGNHPFKTFNNKAKRQGAPVRARTACLIRCRGDDLRPYKFCSRGIEKYRPRPSNFTESCGWLRKSRKSMGIKKASVKCLCKGYVALSLRSTSSPRPTWLESHGCVFKQLGTEVSTPITIPQLETLSLLRAACSGVWCKRKTQICCLRQNNTLSRNEHLVRRWQIHHSRISP